MSKIAAEYIDINQLKPWDKNPRKNDHAVSEVKQSIERFGFSSPIIARKSDNVIIAGHTRWKAAKEIGLKEVPVRFMDLDVVDSQLLAIADNKLNERADWDEDLLEQVLQDLAGEDLSGIGFDDNELQDIIDKASDTDTKEENEDLPELEEEVHSKEGEIYELGPHRLLCGDSTKKENWDLLLDGEKVDMIFTDPPYGIGYKRIKGKHRLIENDANLIESENIIKGFLACIKTSIYFICCDWRSMQTIIDSMEECGIKTKCCIVWDKINPVQNLDRYYKQHEMIIYAGPYGGNKTQCGDIWKHKRDFTPDHPTPKPIPLIQQAIKTSMLSKNSIIIDGFTGSGGTLIAADIEDMQARCIELDPQYCDVIRRRWTRYATENGLEVGSGGLE